MSANSRRIRVAQAIQQALGRLVADEVSDPRLGEAGIMSVTHVDLNADMSIATVYVSFIGGEEQAGPAAVQALEGAARYLRGPLGRRMKLARAPGLRFVYDDSGEFKQRLADLVRGDGEQGSGES